MNRKIIQTEDGSTTIYIEDWDETYHSKFGAIQEARHVFIGNGLSLFEEQSLAVLEIGFGTGLNAFITFLEAEKKQQIIDYVGIEAFPVAKEELAHLNYVSELNAEIHRNAFETMHNCPWEAKTVLSPYFALTKKQQYFNEIDYKNRFNLIYFDAFGFRVQPELWTAEIFQIMYDALQEKGTLVTYACRSSVIKALHEVGFTTEKLPGPPGKREMLRATKC
ncbi:tRNA (5-methylaminomethyl-2-thiouridine)(34)-methyltransferase MnmD [Flavobacterium cerinum]|uniref:tRNA (5-methylaminomethyl-2-thiouridine)(34)-methyltransferase MnmD n=1 Tax=Flavobacterium cerinum TaxID=2502784 RepID=A0ABY5IMC0_9FLAO|nr:tRNA (5-methylaminomethyl-2-thiouridine)(34)-methyltransferase MnmD [Flavobacterium cerinum]UUC43993.1 tRNA (5-methylaminomethyl-2-thiouridine)(34)-methyltransferase MnmD [Flavobacterium cerinum]